MSKIEKIFYEELTFPEVRQIVAEQRVALLPVGTIEQHGPHCPLKVDNACPSAVCRLAAERVPDDAIVMPCVPYGYGGVNMNFPGTINITESSLIGYVGDILFSLAHHGFSKIIVVNGHFGNPPFLNIAMRRLNAAAYPKTVACVVSWPDLIPQEVLSDLSDSDYGGIGHAGELETSVLLHTDPDLVQMDKAEKEMWNGDLRSGGAVGAGGTPLGVAAYVGWMGGMGGNKYGIMGDPTVATAEKGQQWLNHAAEALAELIGQWKAMPIKEVADHH